MSSWIFQANPNVFDVNTYLENSFATGKLITWMVRQKHYIDKISPGDEVFIWRSDGEKRHSGGIVAKGIIISKPAIMEDDEESIKLWKKYPGKNHQVKIFLEGVRLSPEDGMITRLEIEKDSILKNLGIIKFRQLTNYFIDEKSANRIRLLWALKKIGEKF